MLLKAFPLVAAVMVNKKNKIKMSVIDVAS